MKLALPTLTKSPCNFLTAARVVQQCQADWDVAIKACEPDAIKIAYEMRESALELLAEVSPYGLVRESPGEATDSILVW